MPSTRPESGASSPAMMRSSRVFPTPEGPSRPTTWPVVRLGRMRSKISNPTLSRIFWPPSASDTPSTRSTHSPTVLSRTGPSSSALAADPLEDKVRAEDMGEHSKGEIQQQADEQDD